ncbi:hypothetical protein [Rhodococcus globerulus]|uniref:Uncharacterized protein n=1 Tax=Rhodococcus globerulus TaxID=33008 RepID=A0ABU4C5B6_RHOGO|nr:hypothetical protein [Rhodococcus globerulus]MDV6271388.1 hypothetical protein [Rhodococcus globerulus]
MSTAGLFGAVHRSIRGTEQMISVELPERQIAVTGPDQTVEVVDQVHHLKHVGSGYARIW